VASGGAYVNRAEETGMTEEDRSDPYDLQRFVEAQDPVFDAVCAELGEGSKESHWMWFVFPQIEGLGRSPTARRFAISGRDEADAYLRHPVLGPRLRRCTDLVKRIDGRSIAQIFGAPDDATFHSSMTLFAEAAEDKQAFLDALRKYFGGEPDRLTLERM
jgi:uncharacterized protein (DUF1810 family)